MLLSNEIIRCYSQSSWVVKIVKPFSSNQRPKRLKFFFCIDEQAPVIVVWSLAFHQEKSAQFRIMSVFSEQSWLGLRPLNGLCPFNALGFSGWPWSKRAKSKHDLLNCLEFKKTHYPFLDSTSVHKVSRFQRFNQWPGWPKPAWNHDGIHQKQSRVTHQLLDCGQICDVSSLLPRPILEIKVTSAMPPHRMIRECDPPSCLHQGNPNPSTIALSFLFREIWGIEKPQQ